MRRPAPLAGKPAGLAGLGVVLAGLIVAGIVVGGLVVSGIVVLGGSTQVKGASGGDQVVGRVGTVTVTASGLHPGAPGSLTGALRIRTSGSASDQLDAALAGDDQAASVYHRQVSVGEITDLASCDGVVPPAKVVDHWLHYGPLLVPGRSYGNAAPASATLSVSSAGVSASRPLPVTLYFAHAGQLTIDLPVHRR